MNFIAKFFHELRNPHCQHCIDEIRDKNTCNTCEVLQSENDRLVRDNEFLRSLLLENKNKPPITEIQSVKDLNPIKLGTPFVPIAVKRQMLETESRHAAQLKKNAPIPDTKKTMTAVEIEKELATLDELDNARPTT